MTKTLTQQILEKRGLGSLVNATATFNMSGGQYTFTVQGGPPNGQFFSSVDGIWHGGGGALDSNGNGTSNPSYAPPGSHTYGLMIKTVPSGNNISVGNFTQPSTISFSWDNGLLATTNTGASIPSQSMYQYDKSGNLIPPIAVPATPTSPAGYSYSPPPIQQVAQSQNSKGGNVNFSFTTSSGQYNVGDTWTINISGASPNAVVSATSSFNNVTNAAENFGNTDSNGNWSLSGVFQSSNVGDWKETWMVGGVTVGSIHFTVTQPSQTQTNQQTSQQTTSNVTTQSQQAVQQAASNNPINTTYQGSSTETTPVASSGSFMNILGDVQVGNYSIPVLGIVAVGIGVMLLVGSEKRGRY